MEGEQDQLVDDLHRVLKYEVQFSGTFAVSIVVPGCLNPGLDIDGVGHVPLPLTNQTANLIASVGDQAPCGRGTETIIDTTVRDTIQIDASNIRFMNPKWALAVQEWVEKEVWSGLGCAPFTSPPRCEFYKLLLYKPGAHFLPHQDTEKARGMFATLVVVLPSEFTGGEIHVSHGDENKVFDNAEDSAFDTTILAWYTDVTHEVKEITSGYRLALSYHLIDTSPGVNPPHLPVGDSSLQSLRDIFYGWSHDEYPSVEAERVVAYSFTHQYSAASLREVIVKGQDQHIASILKQAGDLEEVVLLMGWLNACVDGGTGDEGWQIYYGKGDSPEYGRKIGSHDVPVMSHVHRAMMWLDGIQDMQGREVGVAKIKLDGDNVLPFRAFSGVHPDKSETIDAYWGNEGATIQFMYKRAALVMFPKKQQLSVMLSSEHGEKWALEELEKSKSEGPTGANREIVEFLARKRQGDVVATILKIAIEWDDVAEWDYIVRWNHSRFLREKGYTCLCEGWEVFDLEGVRPTFEKLFRAPGSEQAASIKFLLFVKDKLSFGTDPETDEWISAQATLAMENFNPRWQGRGSAPEVIEMIRWRGFEFASSVIVPRFLEEHVSFGRRANFCMDLIGRKEELIGLPRAKGHTSNAELFDHILDEVLAAAIPQAFEADSYYWPEQVSSLFSICIPGNRTKSYEDILDHISHPHEVSFYTQYRGLFAKTLPDQVKLLEKHGISVSSSPSREFFRYVIGTYLEEVLGSREGSPYLKFTMLTCGHETCSQVNDFLRSEERETSIPLDDVTRRCIKGLEIDKLYGLFNTDTLWSKFPRINLSKSREAMAAQRWSVRLDNTLELLRTIGTEEEMSQIMGERYQDFVKALEGSQAFVVTETQREEATEGIDVSDMMEISCL